jgi:hypothetical protein
MTTLKEVEGVIKKGPGSEYLCETEEGLRYFIHPVTIKSGVATGQKIRGKAHVYLVPFNGRNGNLLPETAEILPG